MPETSIPEVVYHYCSVDSFVKILQSGQLWGSIHTSLNDYSEGAHFLQVLQKAAFAKVTSKNGDLLARLLDNVFVNIKDYFIASFSTAKDVLSQWRAYADDGRGVCIGFKSDSFGVPFRVPSYSLTGRQWGMFRIDYDLSNHEALANSVVDAVLESDDSLIGTSLERFTLVCKNPAFLEENEVRIVEIIDTKHMTNPDMPPLRTPYLGSKFGYRVKSGNQIVPYRGFEFGSDKKKLHSLGLGPKCLIDDKSIGLFLEGTRAEIEKELFRSSATYY